MITYYGYFLTFCKEPHTIARVRVGRRFISQLFNLKTNKWIDNPSVYGRVTGLESDYNYKKISREQAIEFMRKRFH